VQRPSDDSGVSPEAGDLLEEDEQPWLGPEEVPDLDAD
jgi:hypothetical protein